MTLNSVEMILGAVEASNGEFVFLSKVQGSFTNFSHEAYKIIKHVPDILFVSVLNYNGNIVALNASNKIAAVRTLRAENYFSRQAV